MFKLRFIAAALLAVGLAAHFSPTARAEMLERDQCKALETEKQTLLTASVKAALTGGPDWVKDHLHNEAEIEKVQDARLCLLAGFVGCGGPYDSYVSGVVTLDGNVEEANPALVAMVGTTIRAMPSLRPTNTAMRAIAMVGRPSPATPLTKPARLKMRATASRVSGVHMPAS